MENVLDITRVQRMQALLLTFTLLGALLAWFAFTLILNAATMGIGALLGVVAVATLITSVSTLSWLAKGAP